MSQADLAARLRLKYYTFISQVENGFSRIPTELIGAWAEELGPKPRGFARHLLMYYEPELQRLRSERRANECGCVRAQTRRRGGTERSSTPSWHRCTSRSRRPPAAARKPARRKTATCSSTCWVRGLKRRASCACLGSGGCTFWKTDGPAAIRASQSRSRRLACKGGGLVLSATHGAGDHNVVRDPQYDPGKTRADPEWRARCSWSRWRRSLQLLLDRSVKLTFNSSSLPI